MNRRLDRINSEFQKHIYTILINEYKDPNITEIFSISNVETSHDLKYAKVYVSILSSNEEKKNNTFEAIKRSSKFVKHSLSKISHLRTVPEITFLLDNSIEIDSRINDILSKIKYSTNPEEGDK